MDALDIEQHPLGGLLRPVFAMFGQDRDRLRRYLDEALASRNEWVAASAWMLAASTAENDGDIAAMRVAGANGLERFRALGERWGLSGALRIDGALRLLDADLEGAAAAYTEAKALLTEMGSQDDELFMRVRLGEIATRRGDLGAAREIFENAWHRTQADGGAVEQIVAAVSYAMFEVLAGNMRRAADLSAFARQKLALIGAGVPVRHHVVALTNAVDLEVALAEGNVPLASELAASAYQAAVASKDMPLLAQVAGPLSEFALAVGRGRAGRRDARGGRRRAGGRGSDRSRGGPASGAAAGGPRGRAVRTRLRAGTRAGPGRGDQAPGPGRPGRLASVACAAQVRRM